MSGLVNLPSVERLSQKVLRILGQNPGPFTLQGTNTYLIGSKPPYILVDTGEGKPEYAKLLAQNTTDISDIILTHWHPDHVDGLPSVLGLISSRPRIWKFPDSRHPIKDCTPEELREDQQVSCQDGTVLKVLHTPGHTTDSISLVLESDNEGCLFTADTVLGQGTTVFEDLSTYMSSLKKLVTVLEQSEKKGKPLKVLPGHGPIREDGLELIKGYIKHRSEREESIVAVLKESQSALELTELTKRVYINDNVPDAVLPTAARGIQQHLDKLEKESRVRKQASGWALA